MSMKVIVSRLFVKYEQILLLHCFFCFYKNIQNIQILSFARDVQVTMEIMNSKVCRTTLAGVLPGCCAVTDWPRVQVMMAALICCLYVPSYAVEDSHAAWPQWRGPTRDGKVRGTVWPQKLRGGNLKKLWRYSLGPSYSGPIVAVSYTHLTLPTILLV